uniref:Uncharacterized protein n=1 Tax=Caenorhabditis tropicalis TaxID=1561998 RepID=A0A1I7T4K5_9PELO
MVHFIQFNPDRKIPSIKSIVTIAAKDEEPVKKPLPPFDYNSLPLCDLSKKIETPKINLKEVQKSFLRCVFPLLTRFFGYPEGLLFNFNTVLTVCDDEKSIRDIEIREFGDDMWTVFPSCRENNTLVALGVENKIDSEKWIKETIPNLEMYGTSGLISNSPVYDNFQNVAISGNEESLTMEVMENGTFIKYFFLRKKKKF